MLQMTLVSLLFHSESVYNTEISSAKYPSPNNYHEVANMLRDVPHFQKEFNLPPKNASKKTMNSLYLPLQCDSAQ